MTREEAIKVLLQHSEHWKRLLTENICSKEEGSQTVKAFNMAIDTMRKYQKIEQILNDIPYGGDVTVRRIQEVIEDEADN